MSASLHDMLDEARIPAGDLEDRVRELIEQRDGARRLSAHILDRDEERIDTVRERFSCFLRIPQDIPALTLRCPEAVSC